jgi:hypothetical protein
MTQQPVAIALTLCEQVIVEEGTRNVTLVNCSTTLKVREVPSGPQRLVIHVTLTDGLGAGALRFEVARLDTFETIFTRETSVTFTDPLQEVRVQLRPQGLSFPVEGRYQVSLLADGELIAQRRFRVSVTGETP